MAIDLALNYSQSIFSTALCADFPSTPIAHTYQHSESLVNYRLSK
jgi:hypothetical protein